MQEQRYKGFRNRRWYNNGLSSVQTNNRREVYWNCASPGHYSRDYPQNNQGNDQRHSCQGQIASEPLSPEINLIRSKLRNSGLIMEII